MNHGPASPPVQRNTVRVNDHGLYFETAGQGQPLVLIHGAFGDLRTWDPQWERFTGRYRVLRYDLRGHGRTGVSTLAHYTIATFADDLAALLDALNLRAPVLVGHSLGGVIAQALAVRAPERVRALVLASAPVSASLSLSETLFRYVLFPPPVMRLTLRAIGIERFVGLSMRMAQGLWGREWLGRNASVAEYIQQSMLATDREEFIKIWEAFYSFDRLPLERITCPTLVLSGADEMEGMLRHARQLLRRIPGAEAGTIPNASHAMTLEQPEAFNQALEAFLDRLPSGG